MKQIVSVCVVILCFCKTVESVKCLDCQNVAQPYDCTTVTECGRHEECYTRKEVTDDGNIYYDVGCKDEQICRAMTPFGKRDKSKRATTICDKCCNSDLCNLQSLCGSKDLVLGSGETICFACNHGIPSSQTCNKITLCPQDQLCQIVETTNILGQIRYKSGCANKLQCNSLSDNSNDCTGTRCCSHQLCNTKCDNTEGHTTSMPMQTTEARTTRIPVYVTIHQEQHTTQQSNANTHNMDCNFDNMNTCSWHVNTHSSMTWTFYSSGHNQIFPLHDHTSGHGYFLFTQIKSHHIGGQAELQSPLLEANHQYCFSVWYFIPHKETLVIIIKDESGHISHRYRQQGNYAQSWHHFQQSFNFPYQHHVIIRGNVAGSSTDSHGPISIDDINVRDGVC